jgi:nitroreductase
MELKDAIDQRRSVRDYTDQPLEKSTIQTLLRAAVQAPSAMNLQPWAFAVIQDKAWLKQHSDRAKELVGSSSEFARKPPELKAMLADPEFNIFYNAGTLIVICAKPVGAHPDWDCCLAAQNLMLAAHAQGLATCPIGLAWPLFAKADVKRELDIPEDYRAVLPIIVGYPRLALPAKERSNPTILCWK